MDSIKEIYGDWEIINTAKRLRGALLHTARLLRRDGDIAKAAIFEGRAKAMPRVKMDKETINYYLFMASYELGLIGD